MSLPVIFDSESIIGAYLMTHEDVTDLDARVSSTLPNTFTRSWVKVTQLDATNRTGSAPEHLVAYFLQFDCYAGDGAENPRQQANLLSRTIRAVLKGLEGQTISGAVVTEVRVTSHIRLPDDSFDTARERYVLDVEVMAHG